jgi:hypothetical protein
MAFWEILDDDSIQVVVWGEDEDMPEEPGCVRMSVPVGGLWFKPKPGDPTKSEIIFIAEADLGGNIPGWVTKQVIKDTAYSLVNLRTVMPAYVKKFEKELKEKVIE